MLNNRESKIIQKKMIDKDMKGVDIANRFNTSRQNINNIIHGRSSSQRIENYLKKM